MKKSINIAIALLFCLSSIATAQTQADSQMKQAQEFLANKEYTQARSLFLRAYNSFAASEQYGKATKCGVQTAALYHRENFYKEAFDMLRSTDQLITVCEQKSRQTRPDLRYETTKERLNIYTRLRKAANAKEQLSRLDGMAKASNNDSLQSDFLYTKASHYYTFGMTAQGDEAINQLVKQYKENKQYDKVLDCYRTLIGIARRSGNATMTSRTYDQYIIWKDSVRVLKANDDLAALKKECAEKQNTIDEKESSLNTHKYIIYGLCILAAILAAALIFGGLVLVRFILLTRKQKKTIEVANEHNELKTSFIRNISAQMSPTLDKLDNSLPAVKALKGFIGNIETLSELESKIAEPCEMQEKNIASFCDGIAKKLEGKTKSGVSVVVNAPKLSMSINPEMLEHVLLHLMNNAAYYTPEGGKITLEYKKRGAHTHQFIVTDTGCGIDAEKRETIFKPFAEVKDLTKGDGLGLPICSVMATRMNGMLSLDTEHAKGARFILELHT